MKTRFAVLLTMGMLALTARAGDVHALIDQNDAYWGIWLKPEAGLTEIDSQTAGFGGGAVGIQLARQFYIGVGYYGLLGDVTSSKDAVKFGSFDIWYTGADLGYTFAADQLVHGGVDILLGGGSANASLAGGGSDSSTVFVAVPEASLLVNVAKDVEFGVGASYRYMNGDVAGLTDSDLSGVMGSIFFRYNEQR